MNLGELVTSERNGLAVVLREHQNEAHIRTGDGAEGGSQGGAGLHTPCGERDLETAFGNLRNLYFEAYMFSQTEYF